MVVVRMARGGAKKRPFYRIVVIDSRKSRDGRPIDHVGFFNPLARGQQERFRINLERFNYWLRTGAKPSDRVRSLVKTEAVVS